MTGSSSRVQKWLSLLNMFLNSKSPIASSSPTVYLNCEVSNISLEERGKLKSGEGRRRGYTGVFKVVKIRKGSLGSSDIIEFSIRGPKLPD